MDIDRDQKTLINLEVMAKINKWDHLAVGPDGLLSIDTRALCGLRRWYEGTTPYMTIGCVYDQVKYISERLNSNENPEISSKIKLRLHAAQMGIRAHLEHYSDVNLRAQIQLIVDNISDLMNAV